MKIGVISDTHIPDRCAHLPEKILKSFKDVDLIVHAGDLVDLCVLDELNISKAKLIVVAGNMDQAAVRDKYPPKQIFEVLGFKIGLMHGNGAPANLIKLLKDAFKTDKPDLIIFGHSHQAMNELIDGVLFFNPGSATDYIAQNCTFGIIEINDKINAKILKV